MNFSIEPFVEAVKKGAYNVEGVIVWQDGQFLAHHQFIPEVRRNQFSVSKSFTSAAVCDSGGTYQPGRQSRRSLSGQTSGRG